jgi:hypothetical protein
METKAQPTAKGDKGTQAKLLEKTDSPGNYQGGPSLKNVFCPLDGN